ncbi:MAG: acyltransferase [Acetobacteraceae bacterium]
MDAVRGIAITLVVGVHYWPELLPAGGIGVDLFFVLSGYLIGGILLDSRGAPGFFSTFYLRRAVRILPLYWILLAFVMPHDMPWYLTFTQPVLWAIQGEFPAYSPLAVTWSLAIEEQFYLLLPLAVRFLPQRWLVRVLWLCVCTAPLVRWALSDAISLAWLMLPSRMDSLAGGVLLTCSIRGYARSSILWLTLACIPVLVEAGLKLAFPNWVMAPYSLMAFLCAAGVFAAVRMPRTRLTVLRPLAWLGIGAYSIFLFHMPVLTLCGSAWLAVPAIGILAWLSWHVVEAPLIGFARDHWRYGTRPGAGAVGGAAAV